MASHARLDDDDDRSAAEGVASQALWGNLAVDDGVSSYLYRFERTDTSPNRSRRLKELSLSLPLRELGPSLSDMPDDRDLPLAEGYACLRFRRSLKSCSAACPSGAFSRSLRELAKAAFSSLLLDRCFRCSSSR